MCFQDECWLKEAMELRGITPEALLDLESENPLTGFRSPMAGLKWLVRKFRAKTRTLSKTEAATQGTAGLLPSPVDSPRCEVCGGSGQVLERIEGQRPKLTDLYCQCRTGRELEVVRRRLRSAAPPPVAQEVQP